MGKIKEKFLRAGIDEFLKRIRPYASVCEVEIAPVEIKDMNLKDKILMQEGEKILSSIKPSDFVVTLEINGKELSSEDFASFLEEKTNSGMTEVVFIIGSSHGIGKNVSARADFKMSLSKMTFLHEFARLLLVEQIYRAFKIIRGEAYHK